MTLKKARIIGIVLIVLQLCLSTTAQELNCRVSVNATSNSTSINPRIFKTLEKSLTEFMNNTKWTDEVYTLNQKIPCNIIVNITDMSRQDIYRADITFQSERPVFNSTYSTQLLRHIDKMVTFGYVENDPILYSENQFYSNLASTFAYFANMIIGLEMETYAPKGGQIYFEKCQNICLNTPTSMNIGGDVITGWQASDAQGISGQRTKIGMAQAFLNSRMDVFRLSLYKYHIKGVDLMSDSLSQAKNNIESAINDMNDNNNANKHFIINQIILAKIDEIINIFGNEPLDRRKNIAEQLMRIEPYTSEKLNKGFLK